MSELNIALRFQLEKYCGELNTLFPELEAHVSNARDIAQIKIGERKWKKKVY